MFQQHKPKKNYMEELDAWTNAEVIVPLTHSVESGNEEEFSQTARKVERAIRIKVLESYHNGLEAAASQRRGERQ
jgi:hypothetical protein